MKITVCTPSIRPEGLTSVQQSLEKQTFKDFEWLVEMGIPGRGHDLNAAYNRMLRRAKGELFVSLQDFTVIPPDGLQKFWDAYQKNPNVFFTAPHGKVLNWGDKVEWDWRAYNKDEAQDAMPCQWDTWEIDWGCAPMKALKDIGGFDEELDKYWSSDNVNVGYRAYLHGYEFKNLFSNPAVGLKHDAHQPHPFRQNYNPKFNQERMNSFNPGEKLPYLDDNF